MDVLPATPNDCGGEEQLTNIRQKCRATGTLYSDPDFTPDIITRTKHQIDPKDCELRRANTLSAAKGLQGKLASCWLLAALKALVHAQPEFVARLIVRESNQSAQEHSHTSASEGVYAIRLCVSGVWTAVVIDNQLWCRVRDRRPLYASVAPLQLKRSETNSAASVNSEDGESKNIGTSDQSVASTNEHGESIAKDCICSPALFEKAVAKVHGSYSALSGGRLDSALALLSGAAARELRLRNHCVSEAQRRALASVLAEAKRSAVPLVAATGSAPATALSQLGLQAKHAYTVIDVRCVDAELQCEWWVCLLDPHGHTRRSVPYADADRVAKQLGVSAAQLSAPGAAPHCWLRLSDLCSHFLVLYVCHLYPNWRVQRFRGKFVATMNSDFVAPSSSTTSTSTTSTTTTECAFKEPHLSTHALRIRHKTVEIHDQSIENTVSLIVDIRTSINESAAGVSGWLLVRFSRLLEGSCLEKEAIAKDGHFLSNTKHPAQSIHIDSNSEYCLLPFAPPYADSDGDTLQSQEFALALHSNKQLQIESCAMDAEFFTHALHRCILDPKSDAQRSPADDATLVVLGTIVPRSIFVILDNRDSSKSKRVETRLFEEAVPKKAKPRLDAKESAALLSQSGGAARLALDRDRDLDQVPLSTSRAALVLADRVPAGATQLLAFAHRGRGKELRYECKVQPAKAKLFRKRAPAEHNPPLPTELARALHSPISS